MKIALDGNVSLVVNPLTGAVLLADSDWWNAGGFGWVERRIDPAALPECPCFYEGPRVSGMLTADESASLDSLGFFLTPKRLKRHLGAITDFGNRFARERQTTFFLTPQTQRTGCPLSCVYCFQKKAETQEEKLLQFKASESIESFILRYAEAKELPPDRICIQLFGGEPIQSRFLEFWREVLEMVKRNGWRWTCVTSGATFTPEYFDLFESYNGFGNQEFNITFDAVPEVQNLLRPFRSGAGTHEAIKRNVEELLRRNLPVKIKTVLGTDNIGSYRSHLQHMMEWGWHEGNMVFEANVVQPFGQTETGGQRQPEDHIMTRVIEVLREKPFSELIPIMRMEGKKLTGYLAGAFGLPFPETEKLRRGKPLFEQYPYHAFCNPGKGVTYNISPDGTLRACNWMDGREGFGEGSIFDPGLDIQSLNRYASFVSCHPHCSLCDISTLCGGSCAIDIQLSADHFLSCRSTYGAVIERFVRSCFHKGWVSSSLGGGRFKVIRSGFDFAYAYRDRFNPAARISDPGCLKGM